MQDLQKKMTNSSQLILSLILKQGQRLGGEFQKAWWKFEKRTREIGSDYQ
jgi:hypothetical protein